MRIVARIIVCIFVGVMVTYLLANWKANASASPHRALIVQIRGPSAKRDLIDGLVPTGYLPVDFAEYVRPGVDFTSARLVGENARVPRETLQVIRTGWPAHAFISTYDSTEPQSTEGVIATPWLKPIGIRFLLIHPIWRGLAIDSAFGAIVLFVVWTAAVQLRRRTRADRHRCSRCGYDLHDRSDAESDINCPECGSVFCAGWFTRPRQIWRAWWMMIVALWFALAGCATGLVPSVLWVKFPEGEVLFALVMFAAVVASTLGMLFWLVYSDRSNHIRLAASLTLGIVAATPIVPFVGMFIRYYYGG